MISGITIIDYSKPVTLFFKGTDDERKAKMYTVYVHTFTGLPLLWIDTDGKKDIVGRDEYIRGVFRLEEGVTTRGAGDVIVDSMSIKGRGNTTWSKPKKPYRLKLDHKQPLFDEPKDKSWVLLSNYFDKTMLRISTAFYLGSLSNLEYTHSCHFVELMLNGKYNGTYLLCDKLKIGPNRINVGDDGFLIELDVKRPEDEGKA